MLKVQELQVNYGGIRAVKNISFEVPDGSIVTLVGANGAGKSTTLRTIAGQVKAQAGSITYNGEELLGKPDVDGGLIGGASLKADQFAVIVDAATKG